MAFSWNGTKQDNWDVYVTLVGSSDVRRLTSDPAEDARPTWSPDGRQIAFVRQRGDDSTIHLVSPLGGAERRVGDFRGAESVDWSPDGKWLVAGNSGQLNFGYCPCSRARVATDREAFTWFPWTVAPCGR